MPEPGVVVVPGLAASDPGEGRGVPHRRRLPHERRHPAHVTLRAQRQLPSLRGDRLFGVVLRALALGSGDGLRILHFSVQSDHIHLLVEAEHGSALSRGLQGLAIRVAKAVHRALGRHGRVWGERYHVRALATPREVRNVLVYVLQNWRKHLHGVDGPDPCSSAAWFSGWGQPVLAAIGSSPVLPARTWLAAVGWRRFGLINVDESPARARRRRRSFLSTLVNG